MTSTVFDLPPYRVGPYTLQAFPATKDMFSDKRRVIEHDWTAGVAYIKQDLPHRKTLECLTRSIVSAIHYRSGLDDRSSEESFTHSLATGLVELARNNPEFWAQFNKLLEDEYRPRAGWGRTAAGNPVSQALTDPKVIIFEGHTCKIHWIPGQKWKTPNAYGWYMYADMHIELNGAMYGVNRALVTLHEVFHFLHHCLGLKDRTKEKEFKRTQSLMLLRFIQQNPKFWAWWLHAVNPEAAEQLLAA
jgi:hypothetical protein